MTITASGPDERGPQLPAVYGACEAQKDLTEQLLPSKEHDSESFVAGTEDDERVLLAMGYSQELYRGFSGFMSFAFCFTSVNVIPSVSLGFGSALLLGGPAEIVWSWVVGSLLTFFLGLTMAEITSVYPSAGSVYHWAGQLASPKWSPVASYMAGWFNLLGNLAGDAANASGFTTCVSYAISITHPGLGLDTVGQVLVSISVMMMWGLMNEARSDRQGLLNNFAIFFQLTSSVFIVIVLLIMTPEHATAAQVFTEVNDQTGLSGSTDRIAWGTLVLGITSCLYAFTGIEAGAHMAEETRDARTAAPWGIVMTVVTCAISGFVYILGMLFASPDILSFQNPVRDVFVFAAGRTWGFVLMMLLLFMYFLGGFSSTTVTSRIAFAMARDGALPYSESLHYVNPRTLTPTTCVLMVVVLDCLLLMLPLVNTSALDAFLGVSTVGLQISYAIPILMRCTVGRQTWEPGVWNLGRYSLAVAWIAAVFETLTSFIFFCPTVYPVTWKNMNWTWAVVLLALIVAFVNWKVTVRHHFEGPKRSGSKSESASASLRPGRM